MTNGLIWLVKFNGYDWLHVDGSFELGYFLNSLIQPIDIFGWDKASTQYTHQSHRLSSLSGQQTAVFAPYNDIHSSFYVINKRTPI